MMDGGRQLSGEGVARFAREWNRRHPNHCIPLPAPRIPAVVRIPESGGGEVRVWVKTLAPDAEEIFLSRVGKFYGEFLVVVSFCGGSLEAAVFHIMGREEVAALLKERGMKPGDATVLRAKDMRGFGAGGRIRRAVGAGN